jgi:uncharacterized Tic20 family protein
MSRRSGETPQYDTKNSNKGIASITHILGLLGSVFGPLIVYLFTDDEFVKRNAENAITWQVFLFLYTILSFFLISAFIGLFLLLLLPFINMIFCIVAAVKANNGQVWNYPGTTNLFKSRNAEQTNKNSKETDNRRENNLRKSKQSAFRGRQINEDNSTTQETARTEEELKEMYLNGEISDEEFDRRLEELHRSKELNKDYN